MDGLCLRYGWMPPRLPTHCSCGRDNGVDHALSCPLGGFTITRHNEIRDVTASLLQETCHNVSIEPLLQPLTGERMRYRSAIVEEHARLDVAVSGLWGSRFERTYLIYGFLILMHAQIDLHHTPLSIGAMKKKSDDVMKRE